MVEIATTSGSAATTAGSSQSITTEVSTRPSLIKYGLVDHRIEVATEGGGVDTRACYGHCGDFCPWHAQTPSARERPQLGNGCAVAGHHEAGAGFDGGEYLRVLVAQIALGDDTAHTRKCSKQVLQMATP